MSLRAMRRVLAVFSLCALALIGAAAAENDQARGIDPNQGESLVEVTLQSKAAAETVRAAARHTALRRRVDVVTLVQR